MDHGGEAARTTALGSTNLAMAAGAVQGGDANLVTGTFDGQHAARRASFDVFNRSEAYFAEFARQVRAAAERGEVPVAVFRREPGPAVEDLVLVGLQLPDGLVPAHDNYGYSPLLPRPGAGRCFVVLAGLLPGGAGAGYNGDNAYTGQLHPGAERGEVFIGPLPDGGVGAVFDNFAQHSTLQGARRSPGLGGAVYDNPGMVGAHLRRLLGFAGIGACSIAVNGLAAGPGAGAPAAAFHHFALLLVGLFLVTIHVLRV